MTMLRRPFGEKKRTYPQIFGHGSGEYGGRRTTPAVFGTERPWSRGAGLSARAVGK